MNNFTREYLSIEQIQSLQKQGTEVHYTGWEENTGIQKLYEVRYVPVKKEMKVHTCRIFDLTKTGEEKFRCQVCQRIHDQNSFEVIKKSAPKRNCYCDGLMKRMNIYIPHPISGYSNKPIFYVCNYCGGKYMYHRFICENNDCNNYCDITEVYCAECRAQNKV